MMKIKTRTAAGVAVAFLFALTSAFGAPSRKAADPKPTFDESLFESLEWREVGPYRGGRSAAVTGVDSDPMTYYFGGTGGGVWKTSDGGRSWNCVSDEFFGGSIGAVAVAPSNPNIVYVGGGEKTVRGNVSHGDGMWKSVDAGRTWVHVGLGDSRHIPRIRIHPTNPDIVYAAVLGHLFGPSDMRGVYRTADGGKNWERILFANRDAGAVDLILDPTNPLVIYASTWRIRRTPHSLESGGEGSALWKSTDGGDTWIELTRAEGLPKGTVGIIGITVSPSNPDNLYAIIENENGGVFRSRDRGKTWSKTNESRDLRQRAWYYTRIYADPKDEDSVYVLNVRFHKSKDGGKTFQQISVPHGDNHDLWIAPDDPLRMIEGNDGGATVSFDGGTNWTSLDNQPTAQMYRLSTDNAFPYRILGGQQDNSAVRIRHRSEGRGIGFDDWESTSGGESGHVVAKPDDPDVVYGGSYDGYMTMYNHRTGEFRDVSPWPDNPMGWGAAELEHRFQWNYPIFFSQHDPDTLYAASQYLLRSRDAGASWDRISSDLTRNDKSRMESSGGPITKDNTSVEYYGTIFAALESPHDPQVLWAGSDDGLVHLSRDGGENWTNVTPKGLPEWTMINSIDAHPFEEGGLYVAATRYKLDDFQPLLFRTTDWGATWTRIDRGIDRSHFTRTIRADPHRRGLLYAGTERGIYVSFDDGAIWQPLQLNLPIVPITDLAIKDGDLIAATQGRGYWILDDLTVLRQVTQQIASSPTHLFTPGHVWRIQGSNRGQRNEGTNPPNGVVVHYRLNEAAIGSPISIAFVDGDGNVIREFTGEVGKKQEKPEPVSMRHGMPATPPEPEEEEEEKKKEGWKKDDDKIESATPGMNRFVWDLRARDAEGFEGIILWNSGGLTGPKIVPGTYQLRLTVGDDTLNASFDVVADPRSSTSQMDLVAQYDFVIGVRDKLTEVHNAIKKIRRTRSDIESVQARAKGTDAEEEIGEVARTILETMKGVEEALYQTKNQSNQDPLNFPVRLNDKLAGVADAASSGDFAPTRQVVEVRDHLVQAIDTELASLESVWSTDVPNLNRLIAEKGVPALTLDEEE